MVLRSLFRALPPVARRDELLARQEEQRARQDETIADLRARLRRTRRDRDRLRAELDATRATAEQNESELTACIDEPSWRVKRAQRARLGPLLAPLKVKEIAWTVDGKEAGYEFARSLGLDVPAELARYENLRDLPWDELPDTFVIKSDVGSSSRGVLPLERREDGYLDLLAVRKGPRTRADVVDDYERAVASGRISAGGVIEELLPSPYRDGRAIAPDIKLYCFYGKVGMIMMRDCMGSRLARDFRLRYLAPDGTDLGDAAPGRAADPTLPKPLHLDAVVDAGERVSAAIPVGFIRVDLYERPDRVVFGEITPFPGGDQGMRRDIDRELGRLWEEAEARLRAEDLRSGRVTIKYGNGMLSTEAPS